MHHIGSLRQKTYKKNRQKKKRQNILFPLLRATDSALAEDTLKCPFRVKGRPKALLWRCFTFLEESRVVVGGVKPQRWFPGTRCSPRDPGVKFLWDLKELVGGEGAAVSAEWASLWPPLICTPVTAPADRFGSAAESPVGATRCLCQTSLLADTQAHLAHSLALDLSWPGVPILISTNWFFFCCLDWFFFVILFLINSPWLFTVLFTWSNWHVGFQTECEWSASDGHQ